MRILLAAGVAVVIAVVVLAATGVFSGGNGTTVNPAAVRSCLISAGFDNSGRTGLISAESGGRKLVWLDQFETSRGGSYLDLWFMKNKADAKALAGVVGGMGTTPRQARVEGSAVLAYRTGVDQAALSTVEGCVTP